MCQSYIITMFTEKYYSNITLYLFEGNLNYHNQLNAHKVHQKEVFN